MNKITEKMTKAASNLYSDEKIIEKSQNGTRKGESMSDISAKIFSQCTVDKDNNLIFNGQKIGWVKPNGMGWIDDKAYDKAIKDAPLPQNNGRLPEGAEDMLAAMDDEYDNYDDDYDM